MMMDTELFPLMPDPEERDDHAVDEAREADDGDDLHAGARAAAGADDREDDASATTADDDDDGETEARRPEVGRPRRDPGPMGSEGMRTTLSLSDALSGEAWDDALPRLRDAYPGATEGVLFCVYKLLQDRETSMRDFRDEAMTRGVSLSGRSMHSAKVLLGLAEPATRRSRRDEPDEEEADEPTPAPRRPARAPDPEPEPRRRPAGRPAAPRMDGSSEVERALRNAVQQMQDAAQQENDRLRDAIRDAIDALRRALDE